MSFDPKDLEPQTQRTLGGIATHGSGFKLRFEVLVWLKPGTVVRLGPDLVLFNADDYAKGMEYCLQLPVMSYDMPRKVRQFLKPNPVGLRSVVQEKAEELAERLGSSPEQARAMAQILHGSALRHVPPTPAHRALADMRLREAARARGEVHGQPPALSTGDTGDTGDNGT